MEAGNDNGKQRVVYELWSDEDMRWIEIDVGHQIELAQFLESWCEKNSTIFRRRPFQAEKLWGGHTLFHPIHGRVDVYRTASDPPVW